MPPLRPLCGEAPGRDSNPGWVDLVAGTLTIRPPHLTFSCIFFWLQVEVSPTTLSLQYNAMILQRPRIIVGNAGFEPGSSDSEVWRATTSHLTNYHQVAAILIVCTELSSGDCPPSEHFSKFISTVYIKNNKAIFTPKK